MKQTIMSQVKSYAIVMAAVMITVLNASVARADAFDDKSRAAAAQEEKAAESKAYAARVQEITRNNAFMVGRVPRGATITRCFNVSAFIYRNETNGCWLENTQWKGIPVQVCSEDYDRSLPPEIVDCHYHIARTGQDCEIVRNASIRPRCF